MRILFMTYCISILKFVFSDKRFCVSVCADLCSRAVQQCEYRFAVWDGPGVSDTGLWRAVVPGLQCGGLVPLTSLLSTQPFSTGHKHTGPVPELFLTRRSPLHRDDREPIWPSQPLPPLPNYLPVGEREPGAFRPTEYVKNPHTNAHTWFRTSKQSRSRGFEIKLTM